ncbi:helix-turn-helix transcriptional regulator [Kitasatospora sp. NPDC004669]|uniref:helix-turn-helix domain-containing protein n=1 Tax=Kitasatospora sp. NPDC004669 TaxID=3154555 RepID=UPI0033B799CA
MRSTETSAERFGAWFKQAAERAGYDTTPGSGGRAALAAATGMSPSAIGRTLEGKTLPRPSQYESIARVFRVDVREVLVEAGIISAESWAEQPSGAVRSQSIPLEQQLESMGITDPELLAMAVANVEHAIELSRRRAERGAAANA